MQWYRDTFSSFTPSASIAYRWTDDAMTYVSYAEGFKGGGWNSHFNAVLTPDQQAALQKFKQEEAQTIEVGAKFDLGGTVRLNLAVFTSDYKDMQVTYRGPRRHGVAPFLTNAGKASIDGAEAELTWAPTQRLAHRGQRRLSRCDDRQPRQHSARGAAAGTAGRQQAAVRAGVAGARRPRVHRACRQPRDSAARRCVVSGRDVLRCDEHARDRAAGRRDDGERAVQFSSDGGPWRVTLGVNNATDELYPIAGNSSLTTGSGYAEIAYARPREWFANFQYEF